MSAKQPTTEEILVFIACIILYLFTITPCFLCQGLFIIAIFFLWFSTSSLEVAVFCRCLSSLYIPWSCHFFFFNFSKLLLLVLMGLRVQVGM